MVKNSIQQIGSFFRKGIALPNWVIILLTGLLFSIVVYLVFGPLVRRPNDFLFGISVDAIKNYYTFLYYIKFDHGYWFTGMNYPFGEHFTFPDTQPLLAFIFGFINRHLFKVSDYAVGLMNGSLLFSFVLSGIMLFLVLRHNLLPTFYALLAAGLILFLSPQHDRLTGHYGLAYTFVIPTFWYLIIRIFKAPRSWVWPLVFVVFTLLSGLLHTYFVITGSLFLLAYTFVFVLQEFAFVKRNLRFLLVLIFTAVLPIILFQLWLSLTDPVSDRPKNPYGFFVFHSSISSVFFPSVSPYKETWQNLFKTDDQIWEGIAYVGMIGLLCAVLSCFKAVRYLIKMRLKLIFRPVLPQPLRIGIWAAILTLLFAMAFPFRLGLESLVDIISPLKQFRSLGRFAWIFYYVFSVYTAFYFYQLYRYLANRRAAVFGISLLLIVGFIWLLDAKINIDRKITQMKEYDQAKFFTGNADNFSDYLVSANHYPSDFQAIIPLPYFSIGSDKFTIEGSLPSVTESFRASLNTGLPLATSMMSRTSVSQTMQLLQLLSNDVLDKQIISQFPNQKPILLVVTKEGLTEAEQRLVAKASKIFENDYVMLFELPLEKLKSTRQQTLSAFEAQKATLTTENSILSNGKVANVAFDNFEDKTSGKGFFNSGALTFPKGNIVFFDKNLNPAADTALYEASVWVNAQNDYSLPVFQYKQFSATGELVEQKDVLLGKSTDVFQDWVRATITFRLKDVKNKLVFAFDAEDLIADNFLIKPVKQDVYQVTGNNNKIIFNNFPIKY